MTAQHSAIISRIEAASGGDRELDALIWYAAVERPQPGDKLDRDIIGKWPAYTSSIDAAMTLVPEGWNWMAGNRNQPLARAYVENGAPAFVGMSSRRNPDRQWFEVVAATPALALCAAALKAREPSA